MKLFLIEPSVSRSDTFSISLNTGTLTRASPRSSRFWKVEVRSGDGLVASFRYPIDSSARHLRFYHFLLLQESTVRQLLQVIGPDKLTIVRVLLQDVLLCRRTFAPGALPYRTTSATSATSTPETPAGIWVEQRAIPAGSRVLLSSSPLAHVSSLLWAPHQRLLLQWLADLLEVYGVRDLLLDPAFVTAFVSIRFADWSVCISSSFIFSITTFPLHSSLFFFSQSLPPIFIFRLEFMSIEGGRLLPLLAAAFCFKAHLPASPLSSSSDTTADSSADSSSAWASLAACLLRIVHHPLSLELLRQCRTHARALRAVLLSMRDQLLFALLTHDRAFLLHAAELAADHEQRHHSRENDGSARDRRARARESSERSFVVALHWPWLLLALEFVCELILLADGSNGSGGSGGSGIEGDIGDGRVVGLSIRGWS